MAPATKDWQTEKNCVSVVRNVAKTFQSTIVAPVKGPFSFLRVRVRSRMIYSKQSYRMNPCFLWRKRGPLRSLIVQDIFETKRSRDDPDMLQGWRKQTRNAFKIVWIVPIFHHLWLNIVMIFILPCNILWLIIQLCWCNNARSFGWGTAMPN